MMDDIRVEAGRINTIGAGTIEGGVGVEGGERRERTGGERAGVRGDREGNNDIMRTPKKLSEKSRSLSDGGSTQLSPSPHIIEAARRTSKDDSSLHGAFTSNGHGGHHGNNHYSGNRDVATPVTPHRPNNANYANFANFANFGPLRTTSELNLSLQMPQSQRDRDLTSPYPVSGAGVAGAGVAGVGVADVGVGSAAATPATNQHLKHTLTPTPLSPKLDHSQIYASPTNILPRRSRGLDFSRAATSLHHSTLAEQSSPDSSPTIGGRAMNIPGRGNGEYGADQSSSSLWSMMGTRERNYLSGSVGSATNMVVSGSSSSSGEDDYMDDDMEDAIMSTPQAPRNNMHIGNQMVGQMNSNVVSWLPDTSPAVSSLSSFRTRPRKQPKKKLRGLLGLGFKPTGSASLSKSPPSSTVKDKRDAALAHPRRESISWAANQLHISSTDPEEKGMDGGDVLTPSGKEGQRGVVKRVVTRRGNLFVS